ncbi:DUF3048 domain-containing protein [Streptomyces actuosus]|uniref:DUF3048 domain-containing protein n=1 Tax=Streptomyces actuosus TaxID=1885 RepID=A0ABS2VZL0_STRAS|nr:DUF3048 domain-containing protein [Streptomyces actuosus]MBN0048602.1 DUF3048 domain-containing protein [Streptomyces actuosus]
MRRGARTPRAGTTAAALLAASLTMSLAAACTSPHRTSDDGHAPVPSPTEDRSTGRGSVLAVKIDNVPAARPQAGLDSADVVYAEQVEGGLSRLMAVYAKQLPSAIGPVRSARESDLELLRQFEEPTLAFSGAQSKLLPLIDKAPLRAETPGKASGAFYRSGDKPAPHNLYLRPDRLMSSAPGGSALTTGFRYGDRPSGGTDATTRTVRYPAARFTFTWSGDRHRYLVAMDGTPTLTPEGRRVAASTVVVQYVEMRSSRFHDFLGNRTPYTRTVGSGKAEVLRDGRAYDVTWKRAEATDGTEFTTKDGNPMTFADGQVWVVFAPAP